MFWKLEICCDCEHKLENDDFKEMTEISVQDVKKACEWVIFWCLTNCLIFADVLFAEITEFIKNDDMFLNDWTDWYDTDSWTWKKNKSFMITQYKKKFILNLKMIMTVDFLMNSVRNFFL